MQRTWFNHPLPATEPPLSAGVRSYAAAGAYLYNFRDLNSNWTFLGYSGWWYATDIPYPITHNGVTYLNGTKPC